MRKRNNTLLVTLLTCVGMICTGCTLDLLPESSPTVIGGGNGLLHHMPPETVETTTNPQDSIVTTKNEKIVVTTQTTTASTKPISFTTTVKPYEIVESPKDNSITVTTEDKIDNRSVINSDFETVEGQKDENQNEQQNDLQTDSKTDSQNDSQNDSENSPQETNDLIDEPVNNDINTKDEIIESTEPIPIESNEELTDSIIIKDKAIEIVYGPATQKFVDENDVVQDTAFWSNSKSKFLFGHNYYSFGCLTSVKVGEVITLINDGIKCDYIVIRSEMGKVTKDNMDIKSSEDDTMLVSYDFEKENIRLISCIGGLSTTYRWVVIAEKIE